MLKRLRQFLSVSIFSLSCGTEKPAFCKHKTSREFRLLRIEKRTPSVWFNGLLIVFRWIYSIPNMLRLIDFVCCFLQRRFRRLVTQIIIGYDIIMTFLYILCRESIPLGAIRRKILSMQNCLIGSIRFITQFACIRTSKAINFVKRWKSCFFFFFLCWNCKTHSKSHKMMNAYESVEIWN